MKRIEFSTALLAKSKGFIPSIQFPSAAYVSEDVEYTYYAHSQNNIRRLTKGELYNPDVIPSEFFVGACYQSELIDWLRTEHNIHILWQFYCPKDKWVYTDIETFQINGTEVEKQKLITKEFDVFEDAIEAILKHSLKFIK